MSPTHFDRLKSLPLTILLTVLIWMYAEAKFTATQDHVPLTLRVVSPQGDLVLRALDPTDNRYHSAIALDVTLEGPKNQIDGIDQEVASVVAAGCGVFDAELRAAGGAFEGRHGQSRGYGVSAE